MAMQTLTRQMPKEQHMMKILLASILVFSLALSGCTGMSTTQQRTLTGGAIGAAGGAAIGAMSGNTGLGAAIGGAAGLAGGFLYDQSQQYQNETYQRGCSHGQQQSE
jgi:osmotically inducible lipoprotein OsmB